MSIDADWSRCWLMLIDFDWFWLMLMLWLQAVIPGVTHVGAYHRPSEGNFYCYCMVLYSLKLLSGIRRLVVVNGHCDHLWCSSKCNQEKRGNNCSWCFYSNEKPVVKSGNELLYIFYISATAASYCWPSTSNKSSSAVAPCKFSCSSSGQVCFMK